MTVELCFNQESVWDCSSLIFEYPLIGLVGAPDPLVVAHYPGVKFFPTIVPPSPPKLEQKFDSHRRQFLSQFAELKMPPTNHNLERGKKRKMKQ